MQELGGVKEATQALPSYSTDEGRPLDAPANRNATTRKPWRSLFFTKRRSSAAEHDLLAKHASTELPVNSTRSLNRSSVYFWHGPFWHGPAFWHGPDFWETPLPQAGSQPF